MEKVQGRNHIVKELIQKSENRRSFAKFLCVLTAKVSHKPVPICNECSYTHCEHHPSCTSSGWEQENGKK